MSAFRWLDAMLASDCGHAAARVGAYLYRRAYPGVECFPKQDTIALDCNMSQRAVRRAIKELVNHGLLVASRSEFGSNEYTLTTPQPARSGRSDRTKVAGTEDESGRSNRPEVSYATGQKWPVQPARSVLSNKEPLKEPLKEPQKGVGTTLRKLLDEIGAKPWHHTQHERVEVEWQLKDPEGWQEALRDAVISIANHNDKPPTYLVSALTRKAAEHQPARKTKTMKPGDEWEEINQWM